MEHTCLQGEDREDCLGQIQHPDRRVHRMDMLPIFCKVQKTVGDFIKSKNRGGDNLNLALILCPIPVDHLKYDAC